MSRCSTSPTRRPRAQTVVTNVSSDVGEQHPVGELEDPRGVAVDQRGGPDGLAHLPGQHGRLDALAAHVAHHRGPVVVGSPCTS